eukprot:TRINITY_DN33018_c0_g1_i1.p1 TRINITY_DN33018_c0_g1~~TRINITY_DN33018_c0_g1_i1.p1  ORF type:complete len:183 (+),score=43.91 TRINITY_DN33018_c0_g1_i1:60-551(+)
MCIRDSKRRADSTRESLGPDRILTFLTNTSEEEGKSQSSGSLESKTIWCACHHESLENSRIKVREPAQIHESSENESNVSFITDSYSTSTSLDDFYVRNGLIPNRYIDPNDSVIRRLEFGEEADCRDEPHDLTLTAVLNAHPITPNGEIYLETDLQKVRLFTE